MQTGSEEKVICDGEAAGTTPVEATVRRQRIPFLVSPDLADSA